MREVEPRRIEVVRPIKHETFGNGTAVKAAAEGIEDQASFDGEEVQRIHVDMEGVCALFGALANFPGVQIDGLASHLSRD